MSLFRKDVVEKSPDTQVDPKKLAAMADMAMIGAGLDADPTRAFRGSNVIDLRDKPTPSVVAPAEQIAAVPAADKPPLEHAG